MAEEPQSSPTTPVQQPQAQNNVIPDSILQEIEKVAKMEKDITFLQYRQGSVEKSLTQLQDSLGETSDKSPATEKNVIEDAETKEEKKSEKKEDKDVIKSDELKPQLTTVEKKRYENIGLEFAKGTQKIFKEIRQAEELKQKMSTKKVDDVNKEKKEEKKEKKEKKEGGLGSLFLKLGLAIGAVALILETFKDKIDKIIPDFSVNWNNFTNPIRQLGDKIVEKISSFLTGTIGVKISDLFDTVGIGIMDFFVRGLPQAIYYSGLVVASAFGAKVDEQMIGLDASLGASTQAHIRNGMSYNEAMSIAHNPFVHNSDLDEVRRSSGLTALNESFGPEALLALGKLMMYGQGYTFDEITQMGEGAVHFVTEDVANTIMNIIKSEKLLGGVDEQGNVDKTISQSDLNTIMTALGMPGIFVGKDDKTNELIGGMIGTIFSTGNPLGDEHHLIKAFDTYNKIHADLGQNPLLAEAYAQMTTTKRTDGLVTNEKENKLEMSVSPVEVAQDIFASELVEVYELFKSIFQGDDFANNVISSIESVVNYAYDTFFSPFLSITNKLLDYCNQWAVVAKSSVSGLFGSIGSGGSSGSSGSTTITSGGGGNVTVNNTMDNPVVLIDLSLDETVIAVAKELTSNKAELIKVMQDVNSKLQQLKNISLSDAEFKNTKEIKEIKAVVETNTKDIALNGGRIENIEVYLEKTDNDGTNDEDIEFSLRDIPQAQPTNQQ